MNAPQNPIVARRPLRLLAGAGISPSPRRAAPSGLAPTGGGTRSGPGGTTPAAALLIVQQIWADQALALS